MLTSSTLMKRNLLRLAALAAALGVSALLLSVFSSSSQARDLGIEGQVFEPIEEDFRMALLRLVARKDWTTHIQGLETSAKEYSKNLPDFLIPLASETQTFWTDVGVITSEDIYLPTVTDWETGSVFEPEQVLAVPAGTYLNPISQLPSAAIERLFLFDATSPEQLNFAKDLMKLNLPLLSFMIVAGDVAPIIEEAQRPVFHANAQVLEKLQISAVPSLVGFGRGEHLGHMATTAFKLPVSVEDVQNAWFGLPYPGYDPHSLVEEDVSEEEAAQIRAAFTRAAEAYKQQTLP